MATANAKSHPVLAAETRTGAGKGAARAIRREGKIPAVLYGKGHQPVSLALNANALRQQYGKGRFQSRLLVLEINGEKVEALPRDVQTHPVTDAIEHVDFMKVTADTAIRVAVPVKFLNTEKSVGLKRGGVLNIVRHEVEFFCRPDAIPASISVDVAALDIGHSVHIVDIALPEGVTPTIKRNFTVATIAGRAAEVEETPAAAAAPVAGAAAAPAAAEAGKPAEAAKKEEGKK